MGTDREARQGIQRKLRDSLGRLFGRQEEAVAAWVGVLERMARKKEEEEEGHGDEVRVAKEEL